MKMINSVVKLVGGAIFWLMMATIVVGIVSHAGRFAIRQINLAPEVEYFDPEDYFGG